MYPPARGWGDVSDAMRRTSMVRATDFSTTTHRLKTCSILNSVERACTLCVSLQKVQQQLVFTRKSQRMRVCPVVTRGFLPICRQNVCVSTAGYVELEGKYLLQPWRSQFLSQKHDLWFNDGIPRTVSYLQCGLEKPTTCQLLYYLFFF